MSGGVRRFAARAVIIDLDGTLLDTAADLAVASNLMLADLERTSMSEQRIAQFVGKGVDVLVHRVLTDDLDGRADDASFVPARTRFLEHYAAVNGRHARPFPGVVAGVSALRAKGLRLACVTNKPSAFTMPLLERCGLIDSFDLVVSGDTLERKKPDPAPMLHVAQRFDAAPGDVVAIGDSLNDALAARAAGMAAFVVPYGYNEGRRVEELDADAIVETIEAAAALIDPIATEHP